MLEKIYVYTYTFIYFILSIFYETLSNRIICNWIRNWCEFNDAILNVLSYVIVLKLKACTSTVRKSQSVSFSLQIESVLRRENVIIEDTLIIDY